MKGTKLKGKVIFLTYLLTHLRLGNDLKRKRKTESGRAGAFHAGTKLAGLAGGLCVDPGPRVDVIKWW